MQFSGLGGVGGRQEVRGYSGGGRWSESCAVAGAGAGGGGVIHVSQPIRSVLSRDRDLVLCGEAGLGGLLKVELLEAVE